MRKKGMQTLVVVTCMIYMLLFSSASAYNDLWESVRFNNVKELLGTWRRKNTIVEVAEKGIILTHNGRVAFGEYTLTGKNKITLKEDSRKTLYLVDSETIRFDNIDFYRTQLDGLQDMFYTGDYETLAQNPKSHEGEFIMGVGKIWLTEGSRNYDDFYQALFSTEEDPYSQYWITFATNPNTDLYMQDNVFILGQILGEYSGEGFSMPHILVFLTLLLE